MLLEQDVFCVCDGITLLFQDPYPNPSLAYEASNIAARTIGQTLLEAIQHHPDGIPSLRQAFTQANQAVHVYNNSLGLTNQTVDFITKQYAATVCAFGYYHGNTLYFGQLNDCGVMVFDPYGNREVDFTQNQQPLRNLLDHKTNTGAFEPGSKEEHLFVRKHIVNKRDLTFEEEPILFGVMTGEPEAEHFFHYGASQVFPGQVAFFYTDGFLPYVYGDDFITTIRSDDDEFSATQAFIKQKEDTGDEAYLKEKSIIILVF